MFDTNGDGMISIDELEGMMSKFGDKPEQEELNKMMKSVDTDGKFSKNPPALAPPSPFVPEKLCKVLSDMKICEIMLFSPYSIAMTLPLCNYYLAHSYFYRLVKRTQERAKNNTESLSTHCYSIFCYYVCYFWGEPIGKTL